LRTKGAFLLDAACADGKVTYVTAHSERGGIFQLKNPWQQAVDQSGNVYRGDTLSIPTNKGETLTLKEYI
jgi:hypothetical protein